MTGMTGTSGEPPHVPVSDGGSPRLALRSPVLTGHAGWVLWGSWLRIGGRAILATGGHDGDIHLWSVLDGKVSSRTFSGHTGPVVWGEWAEVGDRQVLVTGGHDGFIRLWDPRDGGTSAGEAIRQPGPVVWGSWGRVGSRQVLAVGDVEGFVRLWDLTDRTTIRVFDGHAGPVSWGVWGIDDGRDVLAAGYADGTVRLWDPLDGRGSLGILTGHTGPVLWGVWGTVGGRSRLVTGGQDRTVRVWDPEATDQLVVFDHPEDVWWGEWGFIDDRPVLATGDSSGTVRLWDLTTNRRHGPDLDHDGPAWWAAWAVMSGQSILATGDSNGTVRLWDPVTGGRFDATTHADEWTGDSDSGGHHGPVLWGTWSTVEGRAVLATGGNDRAVRTWNVVRERYLARLPVIGADATGMVDRLARTGEALAVAELITSKSTTLPLAIGLFGEWGEGKSQFLELVRAQVPMASRSPLAFRHVRQVGFNAWHYAETDLWASLVAVLFRQLADPVDDTDPTPRQMAQLDAEVIARRRLQPQIVSIRERITDLEQRARALHGWRAEFAAIRAVLFGYTVEFTRQASSQLTEQIDAAAPRTWREQLRTIGSLCAQAGWLRGTVQLLLMIAAVGLAIRMQDWLRASGVIGGGVGLVALVHVLYLRTRDYAAPVQKLLEQLKSERESIATKTGDELAQSQARLQTLLREKQNLTAAGRLAGLVSERSADGAYRSDLGLMTRIREDFEAMSELLVNSSIRRDHDGSLHDTDDTDGSSVTATSQPDSDNDADALPAIDRIVVYIDDLDRCPPARVVQLLEAIHLMLALPLFVVVVAVDPRWMLRAIAVHYREMLTTGMDTPATEPARSSAHSDPDDDGHWASTPAQYLDKIFQITLTLPPLDDGGYRAMIDSLVGPASTRSAATDTAPSDTTADRAEESPPPYSSGPEQRAAATRTDTASRPTDAARSSLGRTPFELPPAPLIDIMAPMTLDDAEVTLMRLLGPPLIATPRSVKRLANSYGLFSAIQRIHTGINSDETRLPAMILLATLIGFPHLGPALLTHLNKPSPTCRDWTTFRKSLRPTEDAGSWRNAADSHLEPHETVAWTTLLTGLDIIHINAKAQRVELPESLDAWQKWIIPVGRLCFPSGRIVIALHKTHHPDTTPR